MTAGVQCCRDPACGQPAPLGICLWLARFRKARQPQCSQAFGLSRHQSTRIGVRTIDREAAS
jgi:hypothetical protein